MYRISVVLLVHCLWAYLVGSAIIIFFEDIVSICDFEKGSEPIMSCYVIIALRTSNDLSAFMLQQAS